MIDHEISLAKCIHPETILFLEEKERDKAILALIQALTQSGVLDNGAEYYEAILQREKMLSTGIGMHMALPHAKIAGISEFFIAIGIVSHEGIAWQSIDHLPVKLIFLIGGPQSEHKEYLKLLSKLTQILKDEDKRSRLLLAKRREDVAKIFGT